MAAADVCLEINLGEERRNLGEEKEKSGKGEINPAGTSLFWT